MYYFDRRPYKISLTYSVETSGEELKKIGSENHKKLTSPIYLVE